MSTHHATDLPLNTELVEAIAAFPVHREVTHCGVAFPVPSLDVYAVCPVCKSRIKVRSFGAPTELEDVFDAVAAWLLRPGAEQVMRRRQAEIAADAD